LFNGNFIIYSAGGDGTIRIFKGSFDNIKRLTKFDCKLFDN